MNDTRKNYGLIRLHIDSCIENDTCYIAAVLEDYSGLVTYSTVDFPVAKNDTAAIAAKIVDICMDVSASHPQTQIDALVYSPGARKNILEIGSQFGYVRFALRSELDREIGGGAAVTAITSEWSTENALPKVIDDSITYVATDGSLNKFFAGGSYGWISSDGEFGYGTVSTAESVLLCELLAIKEMLHSMKRKNNIRILVDNRLAIKISRNPESMGDSKLVSARAKRIAHSIADVIATRSNVEFRWIKSHNGHPLNEGADRLARNARLASSFDQDSVTVKNIAQSISKDIGEEYATYDESII